MHQYQQYQRNQSNVMNQKQASSPQVNIYNRHFYLRGAEQGIMQAQYQSQLKQLANKQKISVASYNILCQQLQNNMLHTFKKYCIQSKQQVASFSYENSQVGFAQLQNIVNQLCLIKVNKQSRQHIQIQHFLSQLWLILGEYKIKSDIRADFLYTTLRIFMDPYNLNLHECTQLLNHIPQFKNAQQNRQKFLEQYSDLRDETLTVQQFIKLWKKIRYSNPTFSKYNDKLPTGVKFSFQPQINQKSRILASKSIKKYLTSHEAAINRTLDRPKDKNENQLSRYIDNTSYIDNQHKKLTHFDILYKRRLQKDQSMLKVPSDSSFVSRVSRTARPEQVKQIVNNLYFVREKREDTNFIQRDEQNQLKYCTFSPKINKNFNTSKSSVSPAIKGYDKQLQRLNKGREQKQRKRQAYENLGRVKNYSRNGSKSPNRSIAPSFIDRDTPKLILEINIDGQRVQKLALKGNQNPHLVSKKFVIMHGLEQQMVEVLEELVEQQLKNL